MANALYFLIDTLFKLLLMVVLLRVWLQWARADFYNPMSQFVVKVTNPLIIPLRRVLPSIGRLDTASWVLALLISIGKVVVVQLLFFGAVNVSATPWQGLLTLVYESLDLIFWLMLLMAVLSWISQGRSPVEYVLMQLTNPLLQPIRRVIPSIGGLDLSVLVFIIGLQFVKTLLQSSFGTGF